METQHIGFVRSIAEHGSISGAARELGITQSWLTKIVSRAEDLLGARLFDRQSHGVTLTPVGQVFLDRMAVVEREMRNFGQEVRAMKSGLGGTISVGVGQFWIGRIVPNVIAKLTQTAIDVEVEIVDPGNIDFLLGRITDDLPEELYSEPLAEIRLYLMVRASHPLAALDRPIGLEDIKPYGWVLPASSDPTAVHIKQIFEEMGFVPKSVPVKAISRNLITGLLQTTDLVSVMTDISANTIPEGLRRLDADWLGWSSGAGIIRLRERTLLPCANRFLELLREETRTVIQPGTDLG